MLNNEAIEKVEAYIKGNCPEGIKILNIVTTKNSHKAAKQAAYVTNVQIEEEKTGLQGNQTFNTLKIFRELKKKEKYAEIN
jgi:hypothetical protein